MKSTSVSTKIITILLLLAVIGYFAVQGYNYFVSPETTTLVYRYHSEQSIALRGYVVRDEQVVDCNETLIELKHAEGERVGQGDTIASVYRSADALNATQQLETLRAQKEQLEYAKSASSDAATALRLDTDIREQIISAGLERIDPPVCRKRSKSAVRIIVENPAEERFRLQQIFLPECHFCGFEQRPCGKFGIRVFLSGIFDESFPGFRKFSGIFKDHCFQIKRRRILCRIVFHESEKTIYNDLRLIGFPCGQPCKSALIESTRRD